MTGHFYTTFKIPTHMIVVYGIAYTFIFLCAVVGNVMVVVIVAVTPRMHTVTNVFIANLAVADILVAVFCIPITFLANIYTGWPFGSVLCKLTPYIQGVSVCASVYNLAAIAVDRFLAICFNPDWRIMRRGACLTLAVIWLFSFTLIIPWLVYYQQFDSVTQLQTIPMCHSIWPDFDSQRAFYVVAIFLGTYLLPLVLIFVCYILIAWRVWNRQAPGVAVGSGVIKRCKMNVVKMLVTVVLMFALSWLPLHILYLILHFNPPTDDGVVERITKVGLPLAQWLELSNSGMNAFVYSFFSGNFRRGFTHLWFCMLGRKKPQRGSTISRRVTRTVSEDSTMLARYSLVKRPNGKHISNESIAIDHVHRTCLNNISKSALTSYSSWSSVRDQAFV
ncbi:neuropeptide SIFamide receptor-like [Physella acuta]|uniref:neuropeptide SIFamide receptor-like n=1 Tax=Physella acuta TaxID=109671 RepID=UPI0027DD3908|nr:neuropeptide SIFamide receptor-like [Physella acuta]